MQPRAVEHDPEVVYSNAQDLADLFTLESVHFAQGKSARSALRQRREAVVEYFPKVAALDQFRRRRVPLIGRIIVVPMALPRLWPFEELAVLGTFIRIFAERRLTHSAPKMIDYLMFENANEPRSLRATPFELFVGLERGEKSFLHGVFGGGIVAQTKNGVFEKVVAMVVQPTTRIGGFIG